MSEHRPVARPRRARLPMAAAVALVLGLAACGGSDDGAAKKDPPGTAQDVTTTTAPDDNGSAADGTVQEASSEACDIVSDEVVTQVLGTDDIPRREPSGVVGETYSCIKGSERTDDLTTAAYVNVSFLKGGASIVDQFAAEAESVEVTGFGDRAVFVPSAGALSVAVGSDSYQIQVVKAGRPSDQADAEAVAKDVLG